MPEESSLNPHEILAALGITDVSDIEPVTGGTATSIWRVLWRDRSYGLRVFRPEESATRNREVAAMEAASKGGIPVPEIVRQGLWQNRPVLLLSWLKGDTLLNSLQKRPQSVWELGISWGKVQASMNRLSPPPTFDTNEWINWAGEDEIELKARLREITPQRSMLLHLDYHPLNVMVYESEICGVLDWANARAGDPRADFARTCSVLRFGRNTADPDPPHLTALRRTLERAWRWGYIREAGKLEDMALFHAWAGAAMIRDLNPLLDQPDSWLQNHHLDPVRQWRDTWKARAGIRP